MEGKKRLGVGSVSVMHRGKKQTRVAQRGAEIVNPISK